MRFVGRMVMRCSRSSVTAGSLPFLVAAAVLLPGCPVRDDFYIEYGEHGGEQSSGGTAASGSSAASSGRGGTAGEGSGSGATSGVGAAPGTSGASNQAGADNGSGTVGCVTLTNQGHEYAFCFDALIQADARANCGERGMTLAVIEDQAEDAWIAKTFRSQYKGDNLRAFIGANDVTTEGEWRWADGITFWRAGDAVAGRYTNWGDGKPNDSSSTTEAEDCLTFDLSDGTWDDMSCETELPYVCEPR
jgi:hypothetical protein